MSDSHDYEIGLISDTVTIDVAGDSIKNRSLRTLLACKKSVQRSEFYQAQSTELRPDLVFKIWAFEYQDETLLQFESVVYKIIRTYIGENREEMELICQRT